MSVFFEDVVAYCVLHTPDEDAPHGGRSRQHKLDSVGYLKSGGTQSWGDEGVDLGEIIGTSFGVNMIQILCMKLSKINKIY